MPKRKAAALEAPVVESVEQPKAGDEVIASFTAPALVLSPDVEQYQAQLDAKVAKLKALFSDLAMPEPVVHTSPPLYYRMRAELTLFHKDDDMYYVMFDSSSGKKPPPRVRVDHFPVATKLVNELMEIVRRECLADPVLKSRLFQVNFHTTLSGQAMLSMLYHSPLKDNWKASAQRLRLALAQAPSFIPGGPEPASASWAAQPPAGQNGTAATATAAAAAAPPASETADVAGSTSSAPAAVDGGMTAVADASADAACSSTAAAVVTNTYQIQPAVDVAAGPSDASLPPTAAPISSSANGLGAASQPAETLVDSSVDGSSRDGGPTASTSAPTATPSAAAATTTAAAATVSPAAAKPGAAPAAAAAAVKPCMSRLPHIIGRSRKQKVCLDADYVIERLQVHGVSYEQQQVEGAFSQPNGAVCQKMLEWAHTVTQGSEEWDMLELYCGNGNFTIPLASNFRRVIATEVSKASVEAARHNLAAANLPPSRVFVARMSSEDFAETWRIGGARRRLADIDLNTLNLRTILVDPPRAGLDPFTLQLVSEFDFIVYISCNPETLHANLKVLDATHRVERFAAFDQFPYTPHIETGVYLVKKAAATVAAHAAVDAATEQAANAATEPGAAFEAAAASLAAEQG